MRTPLAAILATAAIAPATAQQPDWAQVMQGLDGVVVYCRSTTRVDYAAPICDALTKTAVGAFDGSGLKVAVSDMVYHGPAARDGEPTEPEKKADGIARPLLIAIHIKGTDDAEPGIYVGVRAAVAYEAATEAGAAGPGRAGDLVVAEEDVVADGARKRLVEAVIGHMAQKTSALVAAIRTGL